MRHGTNSRYVNHKCRCDSCKAAHHRALKLNNTARHRARVWLARGMSTVLGMPSIQTLRHDNTFNDTSTWAA